jgi:hypothetical protein
MKIGRLNMLLGAKGRYGFYRRGTQIPFPAEVNSDGNTVDIPLGVGSLYAGQGCGWKWNSLMDTGVDVRFQFDDAVFIGAICLGLAPGSAVKAIEVWAASGNDFACVGRFDPQTGDLLKGECAIPIGVPTKEVVVRLQADLKDIVITNLDIIGTDAVTPTIYPTPLSIQYGEGQIPLTTLKGVIAEPSPDAGFALDFLRERFNEYFGLDFDVVATENGAISIELDSQLAADHYQISITTDGVVLRSSARLGLLYAVESLVQLVKDNALPCCEVNDGPRTSVRGFHFGLPPREELEFTRRLIRYVLIPMRYNTLFVEFAGGMRFDKHPEINAGWEQANRDAAVGKQPAFPHGDMVAGGAVLEKDEVRAFVEYAKSFGFEVIPEVQSFGHVQYITYTHPEIAEVAEVPGKDSKLDTRSADQPPSTYYHHSYCPLHEKSYEIIYDLIDEIVEVVQPERYVHMGHDEVYQIGLCPRCIDKDHAELYALHVNRMYDYLAKKGLKMMIWCDMLQPTERYKTPPAITKLPRDIVMLDFIWYFHFDLDMEDNILPHGYDVIMGNLYSSHYPRYEQRIAKKGMIGGEVSTWCRIDEYTLGKKGKIFDLMYTAEMLWSESYNALCRTIYTAWIAARQPHLRDELRGIAKPITQDVQSRALVLPVTTNPRLPVVVAEALKRSNSTLWNRRFDFQNAQRLTDAPIEVGVADTFDKLVFLHATTANTQRIAWTKLIEVGSYIVRYVDGSQVEIPIEYAGNIMAYSRRYGEPLSQQYYRHQGYIATYMGDPLLQTSTEDGHHVTALGYEWVNSYPETEIASIICSGNKKTDADILLLGISGIK